MKFWLLLAVALSLFGDDPRLLECNKVFEARKAELEMRLEKIDERQQAYGALNEATRSLLDEKEKKISTLLRELNATKKAVEADKAAIEKLVAENKKTLEAIRDAKMDKVAQTYAKMKPASAAGILANLKASEASAILSKLKPKVVGKILAKMDPQKASQITTTLQK